MNIGLLVLLGITGIGVSWNSPSAGWSSNNKYSPLGALRASAQVISYELAPGTVTGWRRSASPAHSACVTSSTIRPPMVMLVLECLLRRLPVHRFLHLSHGSFYAETNRSPFDLPEAESELTAGYHTEYSAMKFAMFFMAEYANMITVGCVATLLFFGGWASPLGHLLPPIGNPFFAAIVPILWFVFKVFCFSTSMFAAARFRASVTTS